MVVHRQEPSRRIIAFDVKLPWPKDSGSVDRGNSIARASIGNGKNATMNKYRMAPLWIHFASVKMLMSSVKKLMTLSTMTKTKATPMSA